MKIMAIVGVVSLLFLTAWLGWLSVSPTISLLRLYVGGVLIGAILGVAFVLSMQQIDE